METQKRKQGRPRIDNNGEQRQVIQFACSDGTKEVWKLYADSVDMSTTDLFYKMIGIVSGQMKFINWLEDMARQYEGNPNFQTLTDSYKNNREFVESWKLVCRLSENTLMANKGRKIQANKSIPEKLAKEVHDVLYRHFEKKTG